MVKYFKIIHYIPILNDYNARLTKLNLSRNNQFQHKTKPRDYRLSMQSKPIGQHKQLPVSLSQNAQNRCSDQC